MGRKEESDRMTAGRAAAGIILLIAIILMVTSYVMDMLWPFGVVMGMLFIAIALMFLVSWHSQVTAYECAKCKHVFTVSKTEDLKASHGEGKGGGWKLLKCPKCGKRSRAKVHLK